MRAQTVFPKPLFPSCGLVLRPRQYIQRATSTGILQYKDTQKKNQAIQAHALGEITYVQSTETQNGSQTHVLLEVLLSLQSLFHLIVKGAPMGKVDTQILEITLVKQQYQSLTLTF